jgi:hypothetical protein
MKESLVQQCLNILKREDIKNELKTLIKPLMSVLLYEMTPYIYVAATLIFTIFIINLAIFIILISLLRNKQYILRHIKVDGL